MKDIHVKKISTDKELPLIPHVTNKQQEKKELKSTKVKNKKINIKKTTTYLVNVKNKCVHDVKNMNEKTNKLHSCEIKTHEYVQNVTSLNDKITKKNKKKYL